MSGILALLAKVVGERFAAPVLVAIIAIPLLLVLFSVSRCNNDRKVAKQAEQTSRSSEAVADAAHDAVQTIVNRSDAEVAIDAATARAKEEIGNAQSPAAIRDAVKRSLCVRAEYRNDPACKVR